MMNWRVCGWHGGCRRCGRAPVSQRQFAEAFRINVARLRDLEQGRTQPDSAMLAYLTVIAREPEAVERALQEDAGAGG
jgi:transcriptional regulator with XRE-family HTH domain